MLARLQTGQVRDSTDHNVDHYPLTRVSRHPHTPTDRPASYNAIWAGDDLDYQHDWDIDTLPLSFQPPRRRAPRSYSYRGVNHDRYSR